MKILFLSTLLVSYQVKLSGGESLSFVLLLKASHGNVKLHTYHSINVYRNIKSFKQTFHALPNCVKVKRSGDK